MHLAKPPGEGPAQAPARRVSCGLGGRNSFLRRHSPRRKHRRPRPPNRPDCWPGPADVNNRPNLHELDGSGVRRPLILAALATLVLARGALGADPDWHLVGDEAAQLLEEVVRIDTTNPPGNETPAATLLERK